MFAAQVAGNSLASLCAGSSKACLERRHKRHENSFSFKGTLAMTLSLQKQNGVGSLPTCTGTSMQHGPTSEKHKRLSTSWTGYDDLPVMDNSAS